MWALWWQRLGMDRAGLDIRACLLALV